VLSAICMLTHVQYFENLIVRRVCSLLKRHLPLDANGLHLAHNVLACPAADQLVAAEKPLSVGRERQAMPRNKRENTIAPSIALALDFGRRHLKMVRQLAVALGA
jgi:hypothetical protein